MIKYWNPESGEQKRALIGHDSAVRAIVGLYCEDSISFLVSASEDKTIIWWNLDTGDLIRRIKAHEDRVLCLSTIHIGLKNILISGGADKQIKFWDIEKGDFLKVIEGHEDSIWDIQSLYFKNQLVLLTTSNDKSLRFWNGFTY